MKSLALAVIERVRSITMTLDRSPVAERHAYRHYHDEVARLLASGNFPSVLDVGGGRGAAYKGQFPTPGVHLAVLDIDADELQLNEAADEVFVGDICSPDLDLGGRTFDLVMVRAGVEHFPDNRTAVANLAQLTAPGGFLLVTFASRWAPFAILNRLIPHTLKKTLLAWLMPYSEGLLGFKAYYDKCTRSAYGALLEDSELRIHHHYASYDSSAYFAAIPPLYLLSKLVDIARLKIDNPALASYHYFAAVRGDADKWNVGQASGAGVGTAP